ncbi:unnamed protein product, partial [Chrysoparadoxa australica]
GHVSLSLSFPHFTLLSQTCCLVAPDARGHGLTVCDDPADMSVETLTEDTILLVSKCIVGPTRTALSFYTCACDPPQIQALLAEGGPLGCSQDVPMLLVGHSLGGGTAVRVAGSGRLPNVKGVAVIDMVEGTALASLESLPEVMQAIPQEFDTMEDAIEWHVRSRAIRSNASAKVTVPSRMKVAEDGKVRYSWVTWRTNLLQQQQHWEGWFLGLSEMFLALPQPKLLIVAGMDRLDTPLTMGQIQGKFQLKLVYSAGHSIHGDYLWQPACQA